MPEGKSILEINQELARKINQEARQDPQSRYANQFVGIANGQVVAVAQELGDVVRSLRQAEPDPTKCFIVDASRNYDEVVEIWGLY